MPRAPVALLVLLFVWSLNAKCQMNLVLNEVVGKMEPEAGYSACLVTHQVFGYDICVRCGVMLLLCCLRNVRLHICPTYWGFFCFYL